jgi:hypothetical protein
VGQRIQAIARSIRSRAAAGQIPNWVLGAVLVLLTWPTRFAPPIVGLDPSWHTGLAVAVKEGLQFGQEVVFTYGPLGFLDYPSVWYPDLARIAFVYSVAVDLAFAVALVWALRRTLSTAVALAAAYLVLALLPGIEQAIALVAILSLGMLRRGPPPLPINAFIVIVGALAAVEALIKISVGPLLLVMAVLTLIGVRARWWQVVAPIGLFVVGLLGLWVASGQSVSNLPDFVRNSEEIASGYSEAMSAREISSFGSLVWVLAPLAVVIATAAGRYRDQLARCSAVAIVAAAAIVLFKQGVVRFNPSHNVIWISTACTLWLAIPWAAAQRAAQVGGAIALAAIALHTYPAAGGGIDPIGHIRFAGEETRNLLDPSRLERIEAEARSAMRDVYGLDPATLSQLRGRSVSIDPWEIGVVWAYRLNWSPLPVFQNYSAYTSHLDELNAAEIRDPHGPQRILRENLSEPGSTFFASIDGRYGPWDPPGQALATICRFVPLHTTDRWQVLGRRPDRCGDPVPIGTVRTRFGETVSVPAPGAREIVYARVAGVGVEGLERLRALFWRPRSRYAIVNGSSRYRLVPGTAEDGLLLRASQRLVDAEPFFPVPQARTIALTGTGGELRFRFFRMMVRPAGPPLARPPGR